LGGDITIDTFDGKVKLNVPAGTQNGTKSKTEGKGFLFIKRGGSIWGFIHHLRNKNSDKPF
jgi:curved DNA-binding protein